jgi:peptidoglycan glycosyltransferase
VNARSGSGGVNAALRRLVVLFVVAFAVLALRGLWIGVVAADGLRSSGYNPRLALLQAGRGDIVARDGTILARSTSSGRTYPLGPSLAQTIGYASTRYGTSGIERAFDADLARRPSARNPIAEFAALFTPPKYVHSEVVTTIDPRIQATMFDALNAYRRAAGVAIDPRTGEILALASVPSYDPSTLDRDFAAIREDAGSPLIDRSLDGLYPPGSSFKIVTAATGLEDGVITPESTFDDPGTLDVGSFVVHDDEGEATGHRDLAGAFALSSNVDFARIALDIGAARFVAGAKSFGVGEPPRGDVASARDRLPLASELTPGTLAQLGFGQANLLVTPLRMALVAATIAGGGMQPTPMIVSRVENGILSRTMRPQSAYRAISPETAAAVRTLMIACVERGTGTAAAISGISVAGKTGTATNPAGRAHSWFVAFAPADAPRIAVAIVIENAGYGAAVAAPIARRVIATALSRPRS